MDDEEARRHLQLGQTYEDAGEWDLALEEYHIAAGADSDNIASEAHEGIRRVLRRRGSFAVQVKRNLSDFGIWVASNSIKLLAAASVVTLLTRLILRSASNEAVWTMLPFVDLTGSDIGEAVSEDIVSVLHEARLTHLKASSGVFAVSEEVDLPSFCASSHKEALLSSLEATDSLNVSGLGLPVGSALAAVLRWRDIGQRHILGTIRQQGQELCLSAQLRQGRASGITSAWTVCSPIGEGGWGPTLPGLERALAFRILFDTLEGWEASTPASLRLFTEALQHLQTFHTCPTVQEKALHNASTRLEEALSIDPGYTAAKHNLAIAYHNLGQYRKAIDTLHSLRLQPNHGLEFELAYNLGASYYHLLNLWSYDYAEKEFLRVVEGLREFKLSQQSRELCALAHCGLTSVYAQKMHFDADNVERYFILATEHYGEALDVGPDNARIVATAHTAMGMALLNHGQAQEAAVKFEEAVRLKPDYWRAYIHWGRAFVITKDYERAVLCLRQAVALNSEYEFAQYRLGVALKQAGEFDEAMEALARAPGIAQAYDERGSILAEHCHEYEAALAEFEHAIEIEPELSNAMANVAWYTVEAGYQDDRHLDRALECASRAMELSKRTDNAWHRHSVLGRVYLAKNQPQAAKHELETAMQLNERAPQNYYFLGRVSVELGETEKAKDLLTEFLKWPEKTPWHREACRTAATLMRELNGLT